MEGEGGCGRAYYYVGGWEAFALSCSQPLL